MTQTQIHDGYEARTTHTPGRWKVYHLAENDGYAVYHETHELGGILPCNEFDREYIDRAIYCYHDTLSTLDWILTRTDTPEKKLTRIKKLLAQARH